MRAITAALLSAAASFTFAQAPTGPFAPDRHTLFLAHFDGQGEPDFAAGSREPEGWAGLTEAGRFAGALSLGVSQSVSFRADDGNFPLGQGTLEMWIRPGWDGNDGKVRMVLGTRGAKSNYLNINKLASNKFGFGISGMPQGQKFTYARVDTDVSTWRAGEWRHVAVCWKENWAGLWIDGRLVAESRKDTHLAPCIVPTHFSFSPGAGHVDELRISNVVRYGPNAWKPGDKEPPLPKRQPGGPRWAFNEPEGVYRYAQKLPDRDPGFRIVPKSYLDDFGPDASLAVTDSPTIRLAATPGEYEPAAFVLLATRDLPQVRVAASLPSKHLSVAVRRVVRTPMRRLYTAKPTDTQIVSRFLPRWTPIDIPSGEFREVWLTAHVSEAAAPGDVSGAVQIEAAGSSRRVPLNVSVYPFRLRDHPQKHLGTYYRMSRRLFGAKRLRRELADMRGHGVRSIFSGLDIAYAAETKRLVPNFDAVRVGLDHLREAGFDGTVVVGTGFTSLAARLSHRDLRHGQEGKSLDNDPRFWEAALTTMEAFAKLDAEYPQFRLAATHMDEVFNSGRLPLYIRLTKAVRQVPGVKAYITFHTVHDAADRMRREIDPFVDIRGNHGYSFEWWLGRGHTMDEYEAELQASGDEAWFYHNARGVHFTAEWSRIINGVYLWASPFRVHVPWTYQAYSGNPFDDTDGQGHDFGMSFPGQADPTDLVPTRLWEAMREGGDDLRYIATLEAAIAAARKAKPNAAAAAQRDLDKLRSLVREAKVPQDGQPAARAGARETREVDLDTGLVMGVGRVGSAAESPLINALAQRFTGEDWQRLRERIAQHIVRLEGT